MNAGAKGYILKSLSETELQNSVRFIYQGYSQLIGPGLTKQKAVVGSNHSSAVGNAAVDVGNSTINNLKAAGLNLNRQQNFDEADASLISQGFQNQNPDSKRSTGKNGWLDGR